MKHKIKLIIASALSVIGIVSTVLIFSTNLVLPNFPYKISLIQTKINNSNINNQSIKNYLSIDKENVLKELEEKANETEKLSNNVTQEINKFNTPNGVDYGSMLIFIEQKSLEHKLQVLDVEFNDSQNNNTNPQQNTSETPTNSDEKKAESQENKKPNEDKKEETQIPSVTTTNYMPIGEYKPSVVKVKVIGPYANIQNYLENLPKDLGQFNYLDNLKIWKSTDSLAKEGVNYNNKYLFEDEKNIILEFDIVLYNK